MKEYFKNKKNKFYKNSSILAVCLGVFIFIGLIYVGWFGLPNYSAINLNIAALGSVSKNVKLSNDCKVVRYNGNPNKSINIVMVPSGFDGDLDKFESVAKSVATELSSYSVYSDQIEELNILYIKKQSVGPLPVCVSPKKDGVLADRALFCRPAKSFLLASRCFAPKENTTVLVIHNSAEWSGLGIRSNPLWRFNLASISIYNWKDGENNGAVGSLAAHELAHSIFGFADEYTDSVNPMLYFSSYLPNCQVGGCSRWQDLIDYVKTSPEIYGTEADKLLCLPGRCYNGDYYTFSDSIMRETGMRFFDLSEERSACCEYKYYTGTYPSSLCSKFETIGQGLDQACQDHVKNLSKRKKLINQSFDKEVSKFLGSD